MKVFCLAEKDIRVTSVSPLTYMLFGIFSLICAYFFFNLLASFTVQLDRFFSMPVGGITEQPNLNAWVIEPYFRSIAVVMIFITPLVIMRLFQIEDREGLSDFSLTLPISNFDIVISKFVVLLLIHTLFLLISFCFPLLLLMFGDPEFLPIISGCIGLFLCVIAFSAISMSAAFLLRSPLAAGLLSFFLLLLLYTIDFPAESLDGFWANVLRYVSPMGHLESPLSGVLELQGILYFLSLSLLGIFLSFIFSSQRRAFR